MLAETSNLLERITNAISKKWFQKDPTFLVLSSEDDQGKSKDPDINVGYAFLKNELSIELLEKRVAGLEKHNNQLLYFIDFLIDQIPNLVANILQSEHANELTTGHSETSLSGKMNFLNSNSLAAHKNSLPTPREKDVLDLLQKGFCAKEIAHQLFISETTVITHKKHLKEKFEAKNTAELISKASSTNSK